LLPWVRRREPHSTASVIRLESAASAERPPERNPARASGICGISVWDRGTCPSPLI
jgi:hypothetical protein